MAKLVAENVTTNPTLFEETVSVWVYEEEVTLPKESRHFDPGSELATKPQKLSELFNKLHENVKYLPGITLPPNVVANPDLVDSCKDSTILVFVLPHQFIPRVCDQLAGKIVPFARAICCTKGVDVSEKGIRLMSEAIGMRLNIYCGALSGANIATEIAQEKYSETTVRYTMLSREILALTLSIIGSVRPAPDGLSRTDAQGLTQRIDGGPYLPFQASSQRAVCQAKSPTERIPSSLARKRPKAIPSPILPRTYRGRCSRRLSRRCAKEHHCSRCRFR